MGAQKIVYAILAGFIAGTLLLVFIQYNSSKNISTLIQGNEKLLGELTVSKELQQLEKDVLSFESRIRGTVATGDTTDIMNTELQIAGIEEDLDKLQKISDDDASVKYIDELDSLVREKIRFSNRVLDSFHISGKKAAEKVMAAQTGSLLTNAIVTTSRKIENTRERLLDRVIRNNDESGKKAQQFSTALIALVLISAAALFWYIIYTIRRQYQLIRQLNSSEKKLREASRIKENFMANMSHEIRTPLNAILGFTNLLQKKQLGSEAGAYVATIQHSGEALLDIVNDILDLSRIEAGMMRLESLPFSIRSLAHSIQTMFLSRAAEKDLQFSVTVDDALPDTLEGDPTRFTQILVNLIGNAFKFTNKGSIRVRIFRSGGDSTVVQTGIEVRDTGIGIANDKLEYIFGRFQQAEDSTTRKYGGTGLGLSIVKDLVDLQQGTITVQSQPGEGTTFRLMVPFRIAGEQPARIAPEVNSGQPAHFPTSTRILVAEDNEINQSLLRHIFHQWQLSFDFANNGREALEKLQEKNYSLVLMDIQMPVMDGYTTTRQIRNTLHSNIPVIAMTAHALAGEREKCLSFGMNEYISKPVREEILFQLINRYTAPATTADAPAKTSALPSSIPYQVIDLQYMREISDGDIQYEKTVTRQFLEAVPKDLQTIEEAWQRHDFTTLRQTAHNMKTTISVMGLTEKLQPVLDMLELSALTETSFRENFTILRNICTIARREATQFYSIISKI